MDKKITIKNIVTKQERDCQAPSEGGKKTALVRPRDAVLVLILIALIAALFVWQSCRQRGEGGSVRVTIGGQEYGVWPLSADADILLTGADGGTNLLLIREGAAYIQEADCPDGLCVRQGSIWAAGQSIICLPHEIVVEVIGGRTAGEPDAVVR